MSKNKTAEQAAKEYANKFRHDSLVRDTAFIDGWNAHAAQQQAVNPWVKASERLPDMYDNYERHYRVDGKKADGFFVTEHPVHHIVFEHKTSNGYVIIEDRSRVEWLDESLLSSQPAPVVDGELESLRQWKREALAVMPDFQEIGKGIGVPLGESVHDKILPWIKEAKLRLAPTPINVKKIACDIEAKHSDGNHDEFVKGVGVGAYEGATAVQERMQGDAQQFAEWASGNGWSKGGDWPHWKKWNGNDVDESTTADLYAQYQKEKGGKP